MKKKILASLFAFVLLATAVIGIIESKKNDVVLNGLALANVEALADTESITIDCDDWYRETCAEIIINGTKLTLEGRRK